MSSTKLKNIGFTASAFDLLHAGHIAMLKEAKTQCDYLIVGLQTDPSLDRPEKNAPIQSMVERYIQLSAISMIDEIIPYRTETDLMDILKVYPINVRIIGEEYKDKDFTGKQYCIDNGIEMYYNNRQHDFSTSSLRERISVSTNGQHPLFN
jgi:glycerol-3-phosphate cytidylyltransferase|tara:strand:- start:326 stop:778 length:453 start_codon:yes stop_codon:yes gene_type:complete